MALEIAANARKTKMYITAGDKGYMEINFTAGPEEYWEHIHLRDEMEIVEARRCMKVLLERIKERPKIARLGLAYLEGCVKERLMDGARWRIHQMRENYKEHCRYAVAHLNRVYKDPEKPKDVDRLGKGRSQVGMSNLEHLQRMGAEEERKEQARLQRHRMKADNTAEKNGRRRLDSINRAKEAQARVEEARRRRERGIERRGDAQCRTIFPGAAQHRSPAQSTTRYQQQQQQQSLHALPKESLFQHMKRWSNLWQIQRTTRLVRTWRDSQADSKQRIYEDGLGQQRCGSAGLFGKAEVYPSRLQTIGEVEMKPQGFSFAERELRNTTVRTKPILFEMHARQQRENLHEIDRHFRTLGKEAYEVPQGMRIKEERSKAKERMHPQLKEEAGRRGKDAFLRFAYHKLCRRMVESFKTKSGALYNTVTNLLTIADMNIKERLHESIAQWRRNKVESEHEIERRKQHQAQMMKSKKAMKKVAHSMALEVQKELKPKFSQDGNARYSFVKAKGSGGRFLTHEVTTPHHVARDEHGWPIETTHAHNERAQRHAQRARRRPSGGCSFSNGMTFPPI